MKKITSFWNYFHKNETAIKNALLNQEKNLPTLEQFNQKLHTISPHIDAVIKYHYFENKKFKIIITSHGDESLFDLLDEIITHAKLNDNWEVKYATNTKEEIENHSALLEEDYILQSIELKNPDFTFLEIDEPESNSNVPIIIHIQNDRYYTKNKHLRESILIIGQEYLAKMSYSFIQLPQLKSNDNQIVRLIDWDDNGKKNQQST